MHTTGDFPRRSTPTSSPPFPLGREWTDGVLVLRVSEPMEIGASTAVDFLDAAMAAIPDEAPRVVLDVSLVEFFEADGTDALLALHDRVESRGGSLAIVGINRVVTEVFRLAGLDAILRLFGSEGAAVLGVLRPRDGAERWH